MSHVRHPMMRTVVSYIAVYTFFFVGPGLHFERNSEKKLAVFFFFSLMREGFANVGLELSHGKMNARAPYIIVSTANETHSLVKAEATQRNVFLCCVKETTFFFFLVMGRIIPRHDNSSTTVCVFCLLQ